MRGILLDIEGTTTPIRFVYDVLFPFARARLPGFLRERAEVPGIRETVDALRAEHGREAAEALPAWTGSGAAADYALWLMDRDRKSTALKRLQGLIWREGYAAGALHGEVFDDVPRALEAWSLNGIDVRIFSSGSVLAQRLLFSSTAAGDLTRFLKGYFDTEIGPKTDPSSYARIAALFGAPAREILFVSDVAGELDAARTAGMDSRLAVRPANPPQTGDHLRIETFDELPR
jgi:enolase-phosphatase E1